MPLTVVKTTTRRKGARRTRRRTGRASTTTTTTRALVPVGPQLQRTARIPRRQMVMRKGISESGMAFLKCAFASPDFTVDPGKGIPDNFHGRTLSIKDCFTTALDFTAGTDTYIVISPVPGFAYFKAQVPIGNDPVDFVGVTFPSYVTNFGTTGDTGEYNFSKFRYASMAAGLYPTTNYMQFNGSIQSWKVDLNLAETQRNALVSTGPNATEPFITKRIEGIQGIVTLAPRDNYSESFIRGAFTFAFDKSTDFEWNDFVSATEYKSVTPGGGKRLVQDSSTPQRRLTGLGNVNTIVYKISSPTSSVNHGILRVWNCIELQPNTNSSLFQFSGVSPTHDPLALELYHRMKMQFPVAVPACDNSKFWERVLSVLRSVAKAGSFIPGPIGMASSGIGMIGDAMSELFI